MVQLITILSEKCLLLSKGHILILNLHKVLKKKANKLLFDANEIIQIFSNLMTAL